MVPWYNQYHQLCASEAVQNWNEEDPLVQEPAIVSDVEDTQPTTRSKDKPTDRTWTGHNPSVQPYEISYDEDTASTPEGPRGMRLCIPISPSQDQEYEAEDAQPRQATFTMDSALQYEEQNIIIDNTLAELLRLHYNYVHLYL